MNQRFDKILGIIPARYASTRFPGKPLVDIGGRTMIERVCAQTAMILSHFCVATDDERIAEKVRSAGYRAVMTSDKHQSGTDRAFEALQKVQAEDGRSFAAVINIQGDEPFINPEQIEQLASAFDDEATQIATLVKRATLAADIFNPNKPKVVISSQGEALYFSRSPIPFLRGADENEWAEKHVFYNHIGLYGYRADVLGEVTKLERSSLEKAESLEQLRWLENGYRIRVFETELESLSIDTPQDLEELKRRGIV